MHKNQSYSEYNKRSLLQLLAITCTKQWLGQPGIFSVKVLQTVGVGSVVIS